MNVLSDSHDIPQVVVTGSLKLVQDDAQELYADLVLLLELGPQGLDHGVDPFFPDIRVYSTIIFERSHLMVEDPSMVQEVHDVHPSGFIATESRITLPLLPCSGPSDVMS